MEKIAVLGMGYIGLPTASLFASKGFKVLGIDIREEVVHAINEGNSHIYEPELGELLHGVVLSGNLRASTVVESADVFVIAVPTPFKEGHVPDLSYVKAAV